MESPFGYSKVEGGHKRAKNMEEDFFDLLAQQSIVEEEAVDPQALNSPNNQEKSKSDSVGEELAQEEDSSSHSMTLETLNIRTESSEEVLFGRKPRKDSVLDFFETLSIQALGNEAVDNNAARSDRVMNHMNFPDTKVLADPEEELRSRIEVDPLNLEGGGAVNNVEIPQLQTQTMVHPGVSDPAIKQEAHEFSKDEKSFSQKIEQTESAPSFMHHFDYGYEDEGYFMEKPTAQDVPIESAVDKQGEVTFLGDLQPIVLDNSEESSPRIEAESNAILFPSIKGEDHKPVDSQFSNPSLLINDAQFLPRETFSDSFQISESMAQTYTDVPGEIPDPRMDRAKSPHPIVMIGFGGKVVVHFQQKNDNEVDSYYEYNSSAQADEVRIFELSLLCRSDLEIESLGEFPGPLSNSSQRGAAVSYITRRLTDIAKSRDPEVNRGGMEKSVMILWKFISILLENGGQMDLSSNSDNALDSLREELRSMEGRLESVDVNLPAIDTRLQERSIKQIEELLLQGKKAESLELAKEVNLWSHAILISRMIGEDSLKRTTMEYVNQTFPFGSPLRTVYLLSVKAYHGLFFDDRGNGIDLDRWHGKLSSLLSSVTPDILHLIVKFGDALEREARDIHGSHFCYLLADYPFKEVFQGDAKQILLGRSHRLHPRTFISPFSIQRTELFELSRILRNPQFFYPQFVFFRVFYAHILAEFGYFEESLRYQSDLMQKLKTAAGNYRYPNVLLYASKTLEDRIRKSLGGQSNQIVSKLVDGLFNIGEKVGWFWSTPASPISSPPAEENDDHAPSPSQDDIDFTGTAWREEKTQSTPVKEEDVTAGDNEEKSEANGGFWGRLFKPRGPPKAVLGTENKFEFVNGRWVMKGNSTGEAKDEKQFLPPTDSEIGKDFSSPIASSRVDKPGELTPESREKNQTVPKIPIQPPVDAPKTTETPENTQNTVTSGPPTGLGGNIYSTRNYERSSSVYGRASSRYVNPFSK